MSEEAVDKLSMGVFEGVRIATQFIRSRVIPLLRSTFDGTTDNDKRLLGVYARVFNWMQSLEKLSSPADYQAVVTANRALFELTIDLILLWRGGSSHTAEQMDCWEQSAKLKLATTLRTYFEKHPPVPADYQPRLDFIDGNEAKILEQRKVFWPWLKGKHPNRWTGYHLDIDAPKADKLLLPEYSGELATTLEEFYETHMRRMNWSVHGSGLAIELTSQLPEFLHFCAFANKWSSDLAMLCTNLILTNLRILEELPELRKELEQVAQMKKEAIEKSGAFPDGIPSDEEPLA